MSNSARKPFDRTRAGWLMAATVVALLLFSDGLGFAADHPIWKIGSFDHSSGEFRSEGINYADPKSDLVFIVGQSRDQQWYRFQPGPANGVTGGRLHPFTIQFSLTEAPRGVFYLRIAMLYETPRLSFLRLDVNGHSGYFYFHPRLDFHAGDWEGTFVPQTSTDEKTIAIPAAWLHRGENQFVLVAMDDPATAQNSLGAIAPGHTGLVYDALELVQHETESYDFQAFTAQVEPTIFYRQGATGVSELVDVFIAVATLTPSKTRTVELVVGGHSYKQPCSGSNEFGEQRLEFEIPEWKGDVQAAVRLGDLSATPVEITPAKKWTVAMIAHEHLDIGFTDYAAKVAELHAQSIDAAMDLIRKTPDFRWTLDGSWVADQYLNARSSEAQTEFLDHVRFGSIVIPPEISNQHTGNASWEGLARSLYNERRLEREFKLPRAEAAQIVDVPTYTWGYASILHDAGIKYFIAASNSWRAPGMLLGRWNEKSPFYWEGPDGGRVLMWYSRAYLQAHTLFGSPWRIESVRDALPVFLQAYTRPDYTAHTAIIFGTQLENTPLAKEQSEIVASFNREFAWPRLEFSTVNSAMEQIEREWKGEIAVVRGDFGPYWEDGYGSDAVYTAIHRENQHRIVTAEVLGSAVSALDSRVHADKSLSEDAWRNELLYDEHTWTYVGATTQPENHQSEDQIALKEARVVRAHNDINEAIQRDWAQLEALVKPKDNSIAIFNSLNWPRSGLIETDIPTDTKIVDPATGDDVPFEVLWQGRGIALPGFGPLNVRVRFVAGNVPAIGYKLYTVKRATAVSAVRPVPSANAATSFPVRDNVVENQFYRIMLDPSAGAIASIFDKQLGRELVDRESPFRFGSYLYVTGGDDYPNNSLYRFGAGLKPPALTIHAAHSDAVATIKTTPIGRVVQLSSFAPNTPSIQTEILLLDAEKKILITYRLHKDRVLSRESAYIAFPFEVSNPQFTYGSQSGWINPAQDELPGGSREWYLPTTFASVSNRNVVATVVPLDAPLTSFGDIVRANWPIDFTPKSSSIFSWLMNNYWGTNFPAWQGGDFTFRYAISSGAKFDPAAAARFGWNALTPLERDDVSASHDESPLPAGQTSLLEISDPAVTLLTWKAAEDGDGSILRIQESAGQPSDVHIKSNLLSFEKSWLCNVLEDNQSELPTSDGGLSIPIKPFQVLTIRIRTKSNVARGEGR